MSIRERGGCRRATHHHGVLVVHALAEPQGEVAHGLRDALDLDLLVVCERVILGLVLSK